MSLFVIGSVSRVASNLINNLSKHGIYSQITIGDPLPHYDYHNRYYRLQKQLEQSSSKININLTRLNSSQDLQKISNFNDVIYITHDYYLQVISKTKLMELTADLCKNRKYLYFVTPAQYDHFGYNNPQGNYQQSQKKVLQINPNSTFIRSQIQDNTETLQVIKGLKKFGKSVNFIPKTISGKDFAETVSEIISSKIQGKKLIVRPEKEQKPKDQSFSYGIFESIQLNHAKNNVELLCSKYNKYNFSGYEKIQKKVKAEQKTN